MQAKIGYWLVFAVMGCLSLNGSLSFAYDVVLKNGKVIRGTLISENDEMIVMRDASGIRINFKKANVDLEKTASANKVEAAPAALTPETGKPPAQAPPKKPGRVVTEKDLERLREKYDLGAGFQKKGAVTEEVREKGTTKEKSEGDWRGATQELLDRIKESEDVYNRLNQECQKLKGITIQTHRLYEEGTGKPLDIVQTTQEACQGADDAKMIFEQAKQEYQELQEEAKQEGVPPGYTRTEDEYQEKLEEEKPPQ